MIMLRWVTPLLFAQALCSLSLPAIGHTVGAADVALTGTAYAPTCTTTSPALLYDLGAVRVGSQVSKDAAFSGSCNGWYQITYDVSWADSGSLSAGTYTFTDNKDRVRVQVCYVHIEGCYAVPYAPSRTASSYDWILRLTYTPAAVGAIRRTGYLRITYV